MEHTSYQSPPNTSTVLTHSYSSEAVFLLPFIDINHPAQHRRPSDDSSDFEEPLERVDLAEGHRDKNESLEERPQHDTGVCVVVDCTPH